MILYAPHVTQLAAMHPEIEEIGYHCRDYFVGQWDKFRDLHWGVLAHSTHLRGAGTWDPVERRAPAASASRSRRASRRTSYAGPTSATWTRPTSTWTQYEDDPETLVVPNAGEILHRLKTDAPPR